MKNILIFVGIAVFLLAGCNTTGNSPTAAFSSTALKATSTIEPKAIVATATAVPSEVKVVSVSEILKGFDLCQSGYTAGTLANLFNLSVQINHMQESIDQNGPEIWKTLIGAKGNRSSIVYFFAGDFVKSFFQKQRLLAAMYGECRMSGAIFEILSATSTPNP